MTAGRARGHAAASSHVAAARVAAVVAAGGLLAGCAASNPYAPTAPSTTRSAAASTAPAPARSATTLTATQINRQDHPSKAHERRQRAAMRSRPMLPALPLHSDGVTIEIAGLAADGHTTLLRVSARRRGHAHALAVYRRELGRYADSGHGYEPLVRP